jgi:fumarylacetoacetase
MHPNNPSLVSFIEVDVASDFSIQNLPFGIFSSPNEPVRRVGVAIGDFVLDLAALERAGMLRVPGAEGVFARPSINALMATGPNIWSQVRARVSRILRHDNPELRDNRVLRQRVLLPRERAIMHMPLAVAGFTDFYSSKEHATNVGVMFRDKENPLLPNWLHIPIGYNGRASTVVVSGAGISRPHGQMKSAKDPAPRFGPCERLDFELEVGVVIGQSSAMGQRLSESEAEQTIFGFTLLNDWSARDIQQWEYVPLGPFQAKAFATSIGPWIVMREALDPFRLAGPTQDPEPLPYLRQTTPNNYDIRLQVELRIADTATTVCETNFRHMYWSSVQQLMHHASSGCAMSVGDLLGSGTVSGPGLGECGSLLEISRNGQEPLELSNSARRTFLQDGDSIRIRGWCQGKGYRVGFGEVEGTILAAI